MSLFRKICLVFALFLTLVGNSATLGFCLCDNEIFLTNAHECEAERHLVEHKSSCTCGKHDRGVPAENKDQSPCKTLIVALDDDLAGTTDAQLPSPCCKLFFEEAFPTLCALLRDPIPEVEPFIENFKPPERISKTITLPLLA